MQVSRAGRWRRAETTATAHRPGSAAGRRTQTMRRLPSAGAARAQTLALAASRRPPPSAAAAEAQACSRCLVPWLVYAPHFTWIAYDSRFQRVFYCGALKSCMCTVRSSLLSQPSLWEEPDGGPHLHHATLWSTIAYPSLLTCITDLPCRLLRSAVFYMADMHD